MACKSLRALHQYSHGHNFTTKQGDIYKADEDNIILFTIAKYINFDVHIIPRKKHSNFILIYMESTEN